MGDGTVKSKSLRSQILDNMRSLQRNERCGWVTIQELRQPFLEFKVSSDLLVSELDKAVEDKELQCKGSPGREEYRIPGTWPVRMGPRTFEVVRRLWSLLSEKTPYTVYAPETCRVLNLIGFLNRSANLRFYTRDLADEGVLRRTGEPGTFLKGNSLVAVFEDNNAPTGVVYDLNDLPAELRFLPLVPEADSSTSESPASAVAEPSLPQSGPESQKPEEEARPSVQPGVLERLLGHTGRFDALVLKEQQLEMGRAQQNKLSVHLAVVEGELAGYRREAEALLDDGGLREALTLAERLVVLATA